MPRKTILGVPGGEGGNPQSPSPPEETLAKVSRIPKRKNHFFTVNNHTEEFLGGMLEYFNRNALKYRIQEETGKEGTPHLQGCVSFSKEIRDTVWDKKGLGHYEALIGTWEQSVEYCSKIETRTGREWSKGLPKPLKLINPTYWWQREILSLIKTEANDRNIHWYWSDAGSVGKSQFSKYLIVKHKAIFISKGTNADIMYTVMESKIEESGLIVINLPRALGNRICYDALESLIDGVIFSPKYESGYKVFNSPHIIIFANQPPKIETMSTDRFIITQIDDPENNDSFFNMRLLFKEAEQDPAL